MDVKYPEITVTLTGVNGNAFNILAIVSKAMYAADLPKKAVEEFLYEATGGNYDHLLQTCMRWVRVD